MQGTAEFHDQIPRARFEQAQGVFDDATDSIRNTLRDSRSTADP
jgi:hypothetical protein